MKKLVLAFCLLASPALADDPKPPVWLLAIQLKASTVSISYATEAKCREAQKLVAPHVKAMGRADCLPVVQP